MSKGLEALETLMTYYYEMCQDLGNNDDQYQRCNLTSERAIIEKELKALEIIRYKNISIECLKRAINKEGLEWYNSLCPYQLERLTQEEFELLKEVLL